MTVFKKKEINQAWHVTYNLVGIYLPEITKQKREFLPVNFLRKENQLGLKPRGLTLQTQPHVSSLKSYKILGIMGMEMSSLKEKSN